MTTAEVAPASTVDDAIQYARDVVSGRILACVDVKNQCRAFLDDYDKKQNLPSFRWTFDRSKAAHILTFMQLLNFVEGSVAGTPLRLSDWQAFIFINSHGWVDKADPEVRRYTRMIVQVARKNSKSTILAGVSLWELMYAPEGSQIVCMATQREQAKLIWSMARRMIERSDPRLTDGVAVTTSTIANRKQFIRFTPLSRESKRLDGLGIRCAIADESAAISDPNLFHVISSSMGAEKSPQFWHITTAQAGAQSNFYYGQLDYAKKVLNGLIKDDRIFCLAYALDDKDDWDDETKWIKANPNLGKSVSLEFLQNECAIAKEMPSAQTNFLIKYLNLFVSAQTAWIQLEKWDENREFFPINKDLPMYVGLDLGSTDDLTAVSQIFTDGETYWFTAKCFVPEAAFLKVPKHVRAVYDEAVSSGTLIVTEGEVADHTAIREHIQKLANDYDLREVAFDPWSAVNLSALLQESGITMVKYAQGIGSMSPASKETETLIRSGKLKHFGDKFLGWQLSNCDVYTDVNDNIKVRKGGDPALKIDAIIAMIMAVGRATVNAPKKAKVFDFAFG